MTDSSPGTFREDIDAMLIFHEIVLQGSYSAAAARFGLTRSAVSKRVSRLEERLGLRLLHRTTRQVAATEAGLRFHAHCARLLAILDEAEADMGSLAQEPVGTVRINAPVVFGEYYLAEPLAEFQARYPRARVQLTLSDHRSDPVALGLDLVVRVGPVFDDSLVARQLLRARLVTCASPGYLAKAGTPEHPAELVRHRCLRYLNLPAEREWSYEVDGEIQAPVGACPFETDSGLALRGAALAGMGLAHLPSFYVEHDLRQGTLVQVLGAFELPDISAYLVYVSRKHQPAAVRALMQFLLDWFAAHPLAPVQGCAG